jgi:hypothetical protein
VNLFSKRVNALIKKVKETDEGLLDDVVHDLKSREASDINNAADDDSSDDTTHDLKSKEASNINNNGVEEQVKYLVTSCGEDEAVKLIEEALRD